ncbi:MAG: hypothetical protein MUF83_09175 [Acidimicrobiales bacterium]|nr:hypothetical protein [Acidimicrobiales bacterium]
MRRLPIAGALLVALAAILALVGGAGRAASAAPAQTGDAGFVVVAKVTGLVDPVLADYLDRTVTEAEEAGARGLVLRVNSDGVVVSDEDVTDLVERLQASTVPVHVWIGPSGSGLTGDASWLVLGADTIGMAPGTELGGGDEPADGLSPEVLAGLSPQARAALDAGVVTEGNEVDDEEAAQLGITAGQAPTIGDFVVDLPGFETREVSQGDQTRREPVTLVVFTQLSLLDQFMHTVASPAVAYLLFIAGLSLLVFELYTAGVGVAGVVGALSFVLACYGLSVLPVRPVGVALLVLSMVAYAVDVQTGVPRFWTAAGTVLFVSGSLVLYDGVSMSWLTLAVGVVAMLLTYLAGMPAMVRTRFSTPTIGREWMVGEMGRAVSPIAPDGVVQIRGALWRAFTNRATPIDELDAVRVTGIEGLVLEVEPETGAARDYRERRPADG